MSRLTAGQLEQELIAADAAYRPARLPDFELPLQALLQAADRWENR